MNTVNRISKAVVVFAVLGLVALTARAADSFKFNETWGTKVKCYNDEGDTYCDTVWAGKYSIAAKVFTAKGIDPSTLDASTPVSISVGSFSLDGVLGDALNYTDGASTATFVMTYEKCDSNDENCKEVVYQKITLKMGAKGLSIKVTTQTDDSGDKEGPCIAGDFSSNPSGAVAGATMDAYLQLGEQSVSRIVTLTGSVTQKTITKGTGDNAEEFDLTSVKLTGVVQGE